MIRICIALSLDQMEVSMKDNLQMDRRSLVAKLGLAVAAAGFSVPTAAHAAQTVTLPKRYVTVVAFVRARGGKEAELIRVTEALVPKVRQEAGNLLCQAHRGLEVPGILLFYEIFESAAAFEAHKAAPHTKQWSIDIEPLAAEPVEVMLLEALA
jgi:quinol monooxygenase YgiN